MEGSMEIYYCHCPTPFLNLLWANLNISNETPFASGKYTVDLTTYVFTNFM